MKCLVEIHIVVSDTIDNLLRVLSYQERQAELILNSEVQVSVEGKFLVL